MKRWLTLLFLILLSGIGLIAVGNAPRMAEARAHEAAAQALKVQATVTGMAVGGLVIVVLLLVAALLAIIAVLVWLIWRMRLPHPAGEFLGLQSSDSYYTKCLPAGYPLPDDDQLIRQRRSQSDHHSPDGNPADFDMATAPYSPPAENVSTLLPDWQTWEERPWDFDF